MDRDEVGRLVVRRGTRIRAHNGAVAGGAGESLRAVSVDGFLFERVGAGSFMHLEAPPEHPTFAPGVGLLNPVLPMPFDLPPGAAELPGVMYGPHRLVVGSNPRDTVVNTSTRPLQDGAGAPLVFRGLETIMWFEDATGQIVGR